MTRKIKRKIIGLIVYSVFGLYFINYAFDFITMPEFISNIDKWIIFVGGLLIITGGINYIRTGKKITY